MGRNNNYIALGRLSPATVDVAVFTLIRPEYDASHLAAHTASSCDWVSFRPLAHARGPNKIRGNIQTMLLKLAEQNAVFE
jgi:hypothetical protein